MLIGGCGHGERAGPDGRGEVRAGAGSRLCQAGVCAFGFGARAALIGPVDLGVIDRGPGTESAFAPGGEHHLGTDQRWQGRRHTARVEVDRGTQVRIEVTSNRSDELHVHGYDETVPLTAGSPAAVAFVADLPGVFEVETHDSGLLLCQLVVRG